jgi:hypothetical protein
LFAGKWIELENIILSEDSMFRRPKGACFLSYVEYTPNTNTTILCKTRHAKKRSHIRGNKRRNLRMNMVDVLSIQE